jgi:hypothetical protein
MVYEAVWPLSHLSLARDLCIVWRHSGLLIVK